MFLNVLKGSPIYTMAIVCKVWYAMKDKGEHAKVMHNNELSLPFIL